MTRNWQRISFGPAWKGLLNRRQEMVDDPTYAVLATNVEFYGGPIGKRSGTQLINGWGSYVLRAYLNESVITLYDIGPGADGGGPMIGEVAVFTSPDGTVQMRNITLVSIPTKEITLDAPITMTSLTSVVITRPIPGNFPIRGLFHVTFRNGFSYLIAAAGGAWWNIRADIAPTQITTQYPFRVGVLVDVNTFNAVSPTGSVEGFDVGDTIILTGVGPAGADLTATIVGGSNTARAVNRKYIRYDLAQFIFEPAASITGPTTVTKVIASPDPSVDEFGVLFANTLHLASAPLSPTVQYLPRKLIGGDAFNVPVLQQHGILQPHGIFFVQQTTAPDGGFGTTGSAPSDIAYSWTIAYLNSHTGQTSLLAADTTQADTTSFPPETAPVVITFDQMAVLHFYGSADPQVTDILIYRREANSADYFLVGQMTNAASFLSFQDEGFLPTTLARRNLDNTLDQDYFLVVPKDDVIKWVSFWAPWPQAQRLIGVVPRRATTTPGYLIFSDQPDLASGFFKSESFPVNNQIFIGYDDGDDIVSVVPFIDSILVFKEKSVWRIEGIPPNITINAVNFVPDTSGLGSVSAKLIVQDHDDVLFPARDGYHLLSRYEGVNSGFQSERMSLPIDSLYLDVTRSERTKGHAVFFRMKRQLRAWIDFQGAQVFQFAGSEEGGAAGWATWGFKNSQDDATPMLITASTVANAVRGILSGYDIAGGVVPDQVNYLGTDTGLVLQADYGTADLGGFPYAVIYRTTEFAPGGRGTSARARALDLQAGAYVPAPTITFSMWTEQLVGVISVNIALSPAIDIDSPFDLLRVVTLPVIKTGALVLCPGLYHQLTFNERGVQTMYRFFGWDYWFQQLTEQMAVRPGRQSVLESLIIPS